MRSGGEYKELQQIIQELEKLEKTIPIHRVHELITLGKAIKRLDAFAEKSGEGYRSNPYSPFKVIGVIGDDVHSVAYRHIKDGKLYKHDFKRGNAQVVAIERHGKKEILITGDVPLWDEF